MTIKFIDLGMQIDSAKRSFCFYDEILKDFYSGSSKEIWTSWNDFQNDTETTMSFIELEDIKMSCPTWIFQGETLA